MRASPILVVMLLAGPILFGLAGIFLPAFGVMPALGGYVPTLGHWDALFGQPGLWRSVIVSLLSSLVTTTASLGIVLLFLAGCTGTRLYGWVCGAVTPLLSVPHAAAALGLAFLIAPSGFLVRAISPWITGWDRPPDVLIIQDPWGMAMMAGLVIKEIPFLLLMSLAALPQINPASRLAVARTLGYRPVTAWLKTVAPSLYPLIRLPVYAVIAYASSTVDVALILGPTNPPTLSVAILQWFNSPDLSFRFVASAGAVLQLMLTLTALALWRIGEAVVSLLGRWWLERGSRGHYDFGLAVAGGGGIVLAAGLAFLGLVGLAVNGVAGFWRFPNFLPDTITLSHWLKAAPSIAGPLSTSLIVGALAMAISLAVVLAVLENEQRSGLRPGRGGMHIFYLPLIVPQAAFLFGLVMGTEIAGIRPGFWLVVFGHIVFVLPYVYLSLAEAYRLLDPRWAMIAATLGASPDRIFLRVRLPMLLAPGLMAAAVGLAVSVGQYLPTLLLGAGRVQTVTTEALALASGGDRRIIGVWALLQTLLPAVGFIIALVVPRLFWSNRRAMRGVIR